MTGQKGADVFCCLDIMDNQTFLKDSNFIDSSTSLYYYLFNLIADYFPPNKIGLVFI